MDQHTRLGINAISDQGIELHSGGAFWLEPWAHISSIVAGRTPDDEPSRVKVVITFRFPLMTVIVDDEDLWSKFCSAARRHFPKVTSFQELRRLLAAPGMIFLYWNKED